MYSFVKALKALSDETRLRIINLILIRECCVCEVMQALKISQTRASRNLNILYDAGFLKLRKEGLWSLYSLDSKGMSPSLNSLLEGVKQALAGNETARQDRGNLESTVRTGLCCSKNEDCNQAEIS